jgi:two-component system, cell cycle sensor histidine kinase and response regulator CckA
MSTDRHANWTRYGVIALVAVLFGLAIRVALWFGFYVPIPGSTIQMDVREVFLIFGSSLTGPLGGLLIGFLSGVGTSFRWFPILVHMILGLWSGWFYRRFVFGRRSTRGLLASWIALVASYYFLIYVPAIVSGYMMVSSLPRAPSLQGAGLAQTTVEVFQALSPEFVFTLFVTLVLAMMLPEKYRKPLWTERTGTESSGSGTGADNVGGALAEPKGRLGIRLMAWFLLFSIIPLVMVTAFVRDNVSKAFILLDASKQRETARIVALEIRERGLAEALRAAAKQKGIMGQTVFIVDTLGSCIAWTDSSFSGKVLADILPDVTARAILRSKTGFTSDPVLERAVGYTPVEGTSLLVVVLHPKEAMAHIFERMQRDINIKLAVSLLLISLAGGAVIWVLVGRAMKKFSKAAREVGFGNFNVALNPLEMEDEIALLAQSFNEMTDNLRHLHRDMELEIAQRRTAEEVLREREKQFRLLAENSTDMISRHDLDGRYLYVSPACHNLLGRAPEEVVGHPAFDFIHPEDREKVAAHRRLHVASRLSSPIEFRVVRKDGSILWLEATTRIVADSEGDGSEEIHVSSRDVTERLVAERALKENEQLLRTVVSNVPVVLFSLDRNGVFTLSEGRGLEALGLKPGQVVGASVFDVYKDYPEILDQMRQALAGRLASGTIDVGSLSFETYYTELRDALGEANGVIGVARDVTDRKRAEEALLESERMYKTLVEQSSDPVYMLQSGHLVFVNRAWEEIFGYTSAEATAVGFPPLSIVAPEHRPMVQDRLRGYAHGDPVSPRYEMRGMKRDGTLIHLDVSVARIDWNGKPAIQGIYRDLTEQKRSEETARHLQKTESLGVLAGGIAHDFNNLLQGMLGQTSLALSRIPKDNRAYDNVAKAEQAAHRAAELTRQLLAYSGKGKFNVRPLDLNKLIHENLRFLELAIPKGITLQEQFADGLPMINADSGQMQQVVMNLIINAAEALGEQSGQILLGTSVVNIEGDAVDDWSRATGTLTPGEFVLLEVSDNGQGMSPETLRKIFDPFFTTKVTGRGLGLSAVIGIVKGHHGGLRVESTAGRGTSFRIVFPVSIEREKPAPRPLDADKHGRYRGCILIIDDEESVREVVKDMLEDVGIETLVAVNGEEGVKIYEARQAEIDLILLDLSMPGMGGKQAFKKLKNVNPDAKVILSSGYSETEVSDDLRELGLTGFIQKPYRYDVLKEMLRKFLLEP